jgi:hypothetical protein
MYIYMYVCINARQPYRKLSLLSSHALSSSKTNITHQIAKTHTKKEMRPYPGRPPCTLWNHFLPPVTRCARSKFLHVLNKRKRRWRLVEGDGTIISRLLRTEQLSTTYRHAACSFGWLLVLVCSERKVLLAGG